LGWVFKNRGKNMCNHMCRSFGTIDFEGPSEIKKIAFRCRMQNPMLPEKTVHISDFYLAWDLSKGVSPDLD
jgi:hypothetical protein